MLSLPRYVLALIVWVSFFFNIERLHIGKSASINISSPTYVLVAVLLVVGLALPQWRTIPMAVMYILAFLAFMATKVLNGGPYWGDVYTYLTLFELTAVLITVTLTHRVGQLTADFVETARALVLSDLDGRVHPPSQAEALVKREMQSARRRNHALSLVLVEADTQGARFDLGVTAREIQRILVERMSLLTLTRLIATTLRRSDYLVDETDQGRWLLMTSELQRGQAAAIIERLNVQAQRGFGVKLKYGIVRFPEHGLTFEDLVAKAEQDLRNGRTEEQAEPVVAPVPLATDPNVQYSSYRSGTDRG